MRAIPLDMGGVGRFEDKLNELELLRDNRKATCIKWLAFGRGVLGLEYFEVMLVVRVLKRKLQTLRGALEEA